MKTLDVLEKLVKALRAEFKDDVIAPGVVVSYLSEKQLFDKNERPGWYAAANRYVRNPDPWSAHRSKRVTVVKTYGHGGAGDAILALAKLYLGDDVLSAKRALLEALS